MVSSSIGIFIAMSSLIKSTGDWRRIGFLGLRKRCSITHDNHSEKWRSVNLDLKTSEHVGSRYEQKTVNNQPRQPRCLAATR